VAHGRRLRRARRPLLGLVGAARPQEPAQEMRGERADVALLAEVVSRWRTRGACCAA
jgi:hypothetical protein